MSIHGILFSNIKRIYGINFSYKVVPTWTPFCWQTLCQLGPLSAGRHCANYDPFLPADTVLTMTPFCRQKGVLGASSANMVVDTVEQSYCC